MRPVSSADGRHQDSHIPEPEGISAERAMCLCLYAYMNKLSAPEGISSSNGHVKELSLEYKEHWHRYTTNSHKPINFIQHSTNFFSVRWDR